MLTFVVVPSMAAVHSYDGYIDMFDEPSAMRAYPAIDIIEPADLDTSFPLDDPLNGPWADAMMADAFRHGLHRVAKPERWSAEALRDMFIANAEYHAIRDIEDIDYDTPVWAVDEATQAEWLANHGTFGLSVIRES